MRQVVILLMSALFYYSNINAQGGTPDKQNDNTKKVLMQWEQNWAKTLMSGDTARLKRSSSNNASTYTFIDPTGTYSHSKEMKKVTPVIKFDILQIEDMNVNVYENTAVVTFVRNDKGTIEGTPIDGKNRWTDVFVKQKGQWTHVSTQATPVLKQ